MSDRIQCWIKITGDRDKNITGAEFVGLPIAKVQVHHVVLYVHVDIAPDKDLVDSIRGRLGYSTRQAKVRRMKQDMSTRVLCPVL